jgi:hypothetical protein
MPLIEQIYNGTNPPPHIWICDMCGRETDGDSTEISHNYDLFHVCESCYEELIECETCKELAHPDNIYDVNTGATFTEYVCSDCMQYKAEEDAKKFLDDFLHPCHYLKVFLENQKTLTE